MKTRQTTVPVSKRIIPEKVVPKTTTKPIVKPKITKEEISNKPPIITRRVSTTKQVITPKEIIKPKEVTKSKEVIKPVLNKRPNRETTLPKITPKVNKSIIQDPEILNYKERKQCVTKFLLNALADSEYVIEDLVDHLLDCKYKTTNINIIDVEHEDIIIEIVAMIKTSTKTDIHLIFEFLEKATNPNYIMWEQESIEIGRIKLSREIAMLHEEKTGIKGMGKCKFCPSTELTFRTIQLRSGDEGATIFTDCAKCKQRQ